MAFGLLGDSQLRSVEAFFLLAVFNLAGAILNPNTTIYSNSGSSLLGWPPDYGSSGTLTDNSLNGPHVKNSHNKPRPDMKFHVSE